MALVCARGSKGVIYNMPRITKYFFRSLLLYQMKYKIQPPSPTQ